MELDFVAGEKFCRRIHSEYRRFRELIGEFSDSEREKGSGLFIPKSILGLFDPREAIALKAGIKPAMGFEMPFERKTLNAVSEWARKNRLAIAHSKMKFVKMDQTDYYFEFGLDDKRSGRVFTVLSHSGETARKAALLYRKDVHGLGEVLGYPGCCLEAGGKFEDAANSKSQEAPGWDKSLNWVCLHSKRFSPYLNAFSHANIVSHVPCSLGCRESIRYAKELLSLIEEEHRQLSRSYRFFMGTSCLHWNYYSHFLFQGKLSGKKFHYSDFHPAIAERSLPSGMKDSEKEKAISCLGILKHGDMLKDGKERIEVFSHGKKTGEIPREAEYEVVLAVPDRK